MLSYRIIGRNIKAARDRLEMTQEEMASRLNMSTKYYGKLERGEVKQNLDRLEQICEILSIPIESVFAGASPRIEFRNILQPDDTGRHVARIMQECDDEHRRAIAEIA